MRIKVNFQEQSRNLDVKFKNSQPITIGTVFGVAINGVEQPIDSNKIVQLPAYPTRISLGINNVDNTSDLNKPISNAQAAKNNVFMNDISSLKSITGQHTTDISLVSRNLQNEIQRAISKENEIESKIITEKIIDVLVKDESGTNSVLNTFTKKATIDISNRATKQSVTSESTRAQTAESNLSSLIASESTRAQTSESNLSSLIASESTRAQTAETSTENKLNQNVEVKRSGNDFTYNGDTVTFHKKFRNLKTGAEEDKTEVLALANSITAGLMAPSTVQAIQQMRSEIDALEGQTIRLLYTDKENPTSSEILQFVVDSGYTDPTKYEGIAVIVKETNHIWKWLTDDEVFNDFGLDTVNQFTNSQAGIIKGSEEDGQVYAEDDGTGSINGWSTLKGRVNDVEIAITNKQDNINDLENIREGAALGATALQTVPAGYATETYVNNYHDTTKQNTITDLETIRSGAALGATALQSVPAGYATETYVNNYHDNTKQDSISDLSSIRSGAALGGTSVQDVKLGTDSIVTSGTATIPVASNSQIVSKETSKVLTSNSIDDIVREGLGNFDLGESDINAWSDQYKQHARKVIGANEEIEILVSDNL